MNLEKHNRRISLQCPTCGCIAFSHDGIEDNTMGIVTCASCGWELTKSSLIEENSENIAIHAQEVGKAAVNDIMDEFRDSLRKAFSGSKTMTFK